MNFKVTCYKGVKIVLLFVAISLLTGLGLIAFFIFHLNGLDDGVIDETFILFYVFCAASSIIFLAYIIYTLKLVFDGLLISKDEIIIKKFFHLKMTIRKQDIINWKMVDYSQKGAIKQKRIVIKYGKSEISFYSHIDRNFMRLYDYLQTQCASKRNDSM